jgi:sugar lactone lactonase YvrE
VAVDSAGNLFIADSGNHRIRKVSPDGVIRTVAGNGTGGFSGDGGPATSAQLYHPNGVAVDMAGDLFVADQAIDEIQEMPVVFVHKTAKRLAVSGLNPAYDLIKFYPFSG